MSDEAQQLHLGGEGAGLSRKSLIALVGAGIVLIGAGAAWYATESERRQVEEYRSKLDREVGKASPVIGTQGWVLDGSKWQDNVIPVCWETLEPRFAVERQWVVNALAASWEGNSAVDFTEFDLCRPNDPGIHIGMTDGVSVTYGLGNQLDRESGGMLLNFEYATWLPECRRDARIRQSCLQFHAVHEFGHAIGFVHEHNRHDGPGICPDEQPTNDGDRTLTPWDPKSVMNYCDKDQIRHGGRLSDGDRLAVKVFYGPRLG